MLYTLTIITHTFFVGDRIPEINLLSLVLPKKDNIAIHRARQAKIIAITASVCSVAILPIREIKIYQND